MRIFQIISVLLAYELFSFKLLFYEYSLHKVKFIYEDTYMCKSQWKLL